MFEAIRKHTKIMQFLLFLLIVPSFVFFGIDGYKRFREKGEPVAEVGNSEIFQGEWDEAHKREVDNIRAQRPGIDVKLFDMPEAKYRTLERLVRDHLLAQAAEKYRLTTTDTQLARNLESNQAIAALRRADGSLDMQRYQALLASQGMSPASFEASVRQDMSARQVLAGVGDTGLASRAMAKPTLDAFFEQRGIQAALFKATDFASQVNPTDAELDTYYKAHTNDFKSKEQAAIEYVVLDLDAVAKTITPNESDLKTYYEQNAARMSQPEQRRARHILISAGKDTSAADRAKAKALAEQLREQVLKAPNTFADVAKKHSQDPGSAPNGGDLDFFGKGAMVKPFEDAVFAMKVNDISPVVESEFGYHIIQLTAINATQQKSFDDMRPELEGQLRKQQAQRKYAEVAETFSNSVYEQADGLKAVADKLKLPLQTAQGVTREPAPGATGVLANPKLLAALFSAESTEKKRNTDAIEISPNQMVAARITDYQAARVLPLDQVKAQVRERVVAERSAELAKAQGKAKLEAWKKDPATATYPAEVKVSRQDGGALPPALVDAAMKAASKPLPTQIGVDLGGLGYAVVKVNQVIARQEPDAQAAKQQVEQYTREWTTTENQAYYETLKRLFKVKILVPKP